MHGELATLARRVKLIQRAILLCTATALLICSVIVVLFLGTLLDVDFAAPVALLFIGAMLAFLGGLLALLRGVFIATTSLRIGRP